MIRPLGAASGRQADGPVVADVAAAGATPQARNSSGKSQFGARPRQRPAGRVDRSLAASRICASPDMIRPSLTERQAERPRTSCTSRVPGVSRPPQWPGPMCLGQLDAPSYLRDVRPRSHEAEGRRAGVSPVARELARARTRAGIAAAIRFHMSQSRAYRRSGENPPMRLVHAPPHDDRRGAKVQRHEHVLDPVVDRPRRVADQHL